MRPTISVVIPAYNAQHTIIKTLDSVFAQTFVPKEVIIVDDGSVDATRDIVLHYINLNNLNHWTLLHQSNGGPAKARDRAINIAKGSHIALLDADDAWLPSKLELSISMMNSHNLEVIGAHVNANQCELRCLLLNPKLALFSNPYLTSSVIFTRKVYCEVGGFDINQRYSEDFKLWLKFLWKKKMCGQMSHSMTIYRADSSVNNLGLTSQIWLMLSNELDNFDWLRLNYKLSIGWWVLAKYVSLIKFIRRLIRFYLYRVFEIIKF